MELPYLLSAFLALAALLAGLIGATKYARRGKGADIMGIRDMLEIDPEKQARRQAGRTARRAKIAGKAAAIGKGVREGMGNLSETEKAEIQLAIADAGRECMEAGQALAVVAAQIVSKTPNPLAIGRALKEIREAVAEVLALVDLVQTAIED